MALGNIDEDLGLVDNFGVADPAAPSTSTHPTASAQKDYTVETGRNEYVLLSLCTIHQVM